MRYWFRTDHSGTQRKYNSMCGSSAEGKRSVLELSTAHGQPPTPIYSLHETHSPELP